MAAGRAMPRQQCAAVPSSLVAKSLKQNFRLVRRLALRPILPEPHCIQRRRTTTMTHEPALLLLLLLLLLPPMSQ